MTDKYTGRSRGFGFVTYDTAEAATSAIEAMNGKVCRASACPCAFSWHTLAWVSGACKWGRLGHRRLHGTRAPRCPLPPCCSAPAVFCPRAPEQGACEHIAFWRGLPMPVGSRRLYRSLHPCADPRRLFFLRPRLAQELDGRAITCNNARQMVERPEGEEGEEAPRKPPGQLPPPSLP